MPVRRLELHPRDHAAVVSPTQTSTAADRYREAVRVTHFIASGLEDIEDYREFTLYLSFLMKQWSNLRQRKRVRVEMDDDPEPENEDITMDTSQMHSLYSGESGNVQLVQTTGVALAVPACSNILASQASTRTTQIASEHPSRIDHVKSTSGGKRAPRSSRRACSIWGESWTSH